jgi:hypothetical protein
MIVAADGVNGRVVHGKSRRRIIEQFTMCNVGVNCVCGAAGLLILSWWFCSTASGCRAGAVWLPGLAEELIIYEV